MNPAISVLENRLIAFLDALGFSARLASSFFIMKNAT